jgi:hypothetical protein
MWLMKLEIWINNRYNLKRNSYSRKHIPNPEVMKENMKKLINDFSNSNNINVNNHVVIEEDGLPTLMDILEEKKHKFI